MQADFYEVQASFDLRRIPVKDDIFLTWMLKKDKENKMLPKCKRAGFPVCTTVAKGKSNDLPFLLLIPQSQASLLKNSLHGNTILY